MELFFLAAGGLIVAGYWGYRKLQAMEQQIRAELDEEARERSGENPPEPATVEKPSEVSETVSIEAQLLQRLREQPGMLQTRLYEAFPDRSRKELQALLLRMDREGLLRRVRKGNSYELHPQ